MPTLLKIACSMYVAVMLAQAAFSPLHEEGVWIWTTSILNLALAGLAVLFARRRQWAWRWMMWAAAFGALINAMFFPMPEHFSQYLSAARILAGAEIAASAAILWCLLRDDATRSWFSGSGEAG